MRQIRSITPTLLPITQKICKNSKCALHTVRFEFLRRSKVIKTCEDNAKSLKQNF